MAEPVSPENCLDPSAHDGPFRYCPYCSWTEADDAGPCLARVVWRNAVASPEFICESYEAHAGPHRFTLLGAEPPAKLTWEGGEHA